jgi:hypothetical protein
MADISVFDGLTGEVTVRDFTEEELLQREQTLQIIAAEKAVEETQAANKQSALNKLMALGLTEEEALALGVK